MADIKSELRARLEGIEGRRRAEDERHEAVHQQLDREADIVKAMLALEEGHGLNGIGAPSNKKKKPLRAGAANAVESEILELLSINSAEHGALKEHLIEQGLGSADDPNFGRSLQGTLLSMRGRELVDLIGKGVWAIGEKGK